MKCKLGRYNYTSGGQFDFLDGIACLRPVNQALLGIVSHKYHFINGVQLPEIHPSVEGEWQVSDVVLSMESAFTS